MRKKSRDGVVFIFEHVSFLVGLWDNTKRKMFHF